MKYHLISLGCARNLVDSETMKARLVSAGWEETEDPDDAVLLVVNTCGFIEAAINESVETILELAQCKETGVCERLIVVGCLPERYGDELARELPEVDLFLGTGAFDRIAHAAGPGFGDGRSLFPRPDSMPLADHNTPRISTYSHMSYVKIAEGCSSRCTYCIIPKLRGRLRSRPKEDIIAECRGFVESGVKEIVLISQETTNYGKDLEGAKGLGGLLTDISKISDDVWIRFLYGHPESLDESVINAVAQRENICSYFDLPIQHACDGILKRMGRRYTRDGLLRLFQKIRTRIPKAALRTTVIVGFPGETEKDVDELMEFMDEVRFDHLGVFVYSDSDDLPSHRLPGHVTEKVALDRRDKVMSRQMDISDDINRKYLDNVLTVLVEESPEESVFLGRTAFQAPEVDGITYIKGGNLRVGDFARVKINDALEYDLIGEVV